MRSECGLKNERFGEFWGVVQRALKNIDFIKEVKGNLRAGSGAGGLGRAHGEGGRLDGCEWHGSWFHVSLLVCMSYDEKVARNCIS